MIGKVEKDHSSCVMEGLGDILTAERQIVMFLKLDRGDFPLARINDEDGKELRQKEKNIGITPRAVPAYWWPGDAKDVMEMWPRASNEYTVQGVPTDERPYPRPQTSPPA